MSSSHPDILHAAPKGVAIFAVRNCHFCARAEALLQAKGAGRIERVDVGEDEEQRARLAHPPRDGAPSPRYSSLANSSAASTT